MVLDLVVDVFLYMFRAIFALKYHQLNGCLKMFFVFLVEIRRSDVCTKVVYCTVISVSWRHFDFYFVLLGEDTSEED